MSKGEVRQKLEDLAEEVFQYDEDGKEVMSPMKYCGVDHSPEDYEGIKAYNPSNIKMYINGVEITGFMNSEENNDED